MKTISKEFFVSKSPAQLEKFIDTIFQHYRREGFPYFPSNAGYRNARFNELVEADINTVLRNNIVTRTTHGISLAWTYFKHAFEVKCGKMYSPIECFNDDKMLKGVITKACKLGDSISDSTIRGLLRLYSGVQAVSNFRPTAAAALYQHYAQKGVVWDMSGGWGGRLLGAIRADVDYYIATEPSSLTHKGLCVLGNDYWKKSKFEIRKEGSEVFKPHKNSLSFCFTSPPYFDLEKYSDEKTQSFKKYSSKKEWVEGFLMQTFENCHHGLKSGRCMAINIADPKKEKKISLEVETVNAAKRIGFTHVNTLSLMLKSPLGSGKDYKFEPIFIFKK